MTIGQRIDDFIRLGDWLAEPANREPLVRRTEQHNGWFTAENTSYAMDAVQPWLTRDALSKWLTKVPEIMPEPKTVGVVMAGNIPMVGFHDMLCVLASGHRLMAKTSSQDDVILPALGQVLMSINSGWASFLSFQERINGADAVIATGSNNSARYFEYYFRNIPLLLRKGRSSLAVLSGDESDADLNALGNDIFRYFGLGCRNVSRILIPDDYPIDRLIGALLPWASVLEHHKYANAYTYQRALLLVDQQPFTDNGFCIFRESDMPSSPVSVVHYSRYLSEEHLKALLSSVQGSTQCIVAGHSGPAGAIPFGTTQHPSLDDYADGVNTLAFLSRL